MNKNIYKFNLFNSKDIVAGISTRYFGDIKTKKNLNRFLGAMNIDTKKIVLAKQIHSEKVSIIDSAKKKIINNADGLITNKKNIALGIVTADCLPIIFHDENKGIIGVAHAGYKGLIKGIIQQMVKKIKDLNGDLKNIKVCIGPSIGPCCYDVPQKRIKMFDKKLNKLNSFKLRKGKYFLDLKDIAKKILLKEKINIKNIQLSKLCTKCNIDNFFSYRGDGKSFGEFVTVVQRL